MLAVSGSGRLTHDAEWKESKEGKGWVNFSVATDRGFGDKKQTDFFRCSLWGGQKLAETLRKGTLVWIKGHMETARKENITYYNVSLDWDGLQILAYAKDKDNENSESKEPQAVATATDDEAPF
jgi:single-strand DNA-binding protein